MIYVNIAGYRRVSNSRALPARVSEHVGQLHLHLQSRIQIEQ